MSSCGCDRPPKTAANRCRENGESPYNMDVAKVYIV
jgi:hypothetical protein